MRKIGILVISAILALVLFNCEKLEDEISGVKEFDKLAIKRDRISFLKSSNISSDDYKNQQDFILHSVNQTNDTTFIFIIEYLVSDINNPHEFDIVWDEKLDANDEGKIWMNLNMYHKTLEESADITLMDSTLIIISALKSIDDEILLKLWLKFNNTTKEDNSFEVQYIKDIYNTNQDSTLIGGTVQDSTQMNGTAQDSTQTGGTVQDSTGYENGGTTGTESGGTVQDSTSTETGGTVQDSTGYENGGTTGTGSGGTVQDSISTETGGTVQDSTEYETGGTTGTETGGTVQDSTSTETGGTVQDSTGYSGN